MNNYDSLASILDMDITNYLFERRIKIFLFWDRMETNTIGLLYCCTYFKRDWIQLYEAIYGDTKIIPCEKQKVIGNTFIVDDILL